MTTASPAGLRVRVGDQMPSVGLRATDGYLLNLRSFVTKQPVLLLFFGAPTHTGAARRKGLKAVEGLAAGYERLREAGIAVFGPSKDSAQIEGSKAFAKDVMAAAGVPTAMARVCSTPQEAADALFRGVVSASSAIGAATDDDDVPYRLPVHEDDAGYSRMPTTCCNHASCFGSREGAARRRSSMFRGTGVRGSSGPYRSRHSSRMKSIPYNTAS